MGRPLVGWISAGRSAAYYSFGAVLFVSEGVDS